MYPDNKFYKIWNKNILTQILFCKSEASDNLSHYGKYYFETWDCCPKIWQWEWKHLFFFFTFICRFKLYEEAQTE